MVRPAGSPVALQVSGFPAVEDPWMGWLRLTRTGLVRVPGLVIDTESWMATVSISTHPFAPPLNDALLHSDATAKDPVPSPRLNGPPAPVGSPRHLSPISPPDTLSLGSNQPLPNGSVIVPAYSAPPMMLHPSLSPPGVGLTESLPHLFAPASGMYGRLMYGSL